MSDNSVITRAIHAASPQIAVIREAECIGCTKCIQACPVDAIIGANKQMHTVMADVCIGCELCVSPCPVDCIDLIPRPAKHPIEQHQFSERSLQRAQQQKLRITQRSEQNPTQSLSQDFKNQSLANRQDAIQAAVSRSLAKKVQRKNSEI